MPRRSRVRNGNFLTQRCPENRGGCKLSFFAGYERKKANRTKTYQPYRDRQREEEIVSRLAGYFPDYDESLDQLVRMMEDLHLSIKELTKGKMHLPAYRALYLDKMLEGQEGGKADLRKMDLLKADLLITLYDLLKRDIAVYDEVTFRFEIIDEAQYIKTHTTAAAKSVKLIRSVTKFALTGTPIENRLSELWSIFDYLMPGFLFAYDSFRTQMEVPIVKNEDEEVLERLHKMIAPFILRRIKRDVLWDLPDKLEEIRYAGMESKQQKLYDAQVIRMRNDLKKQSDTDFKRSKIEILSELMKIRQICCDPLLCYTNYNEESAKTELCMELLRSLMDGGHRTLVFSQFTMLEILESRLTEEKIPYYVITGSTEKEERIKRVKAFNEGNVPAFSDFIESGRNRAEPRGGEQRHSFRPLVEHGSGEPGERSRTPDRTDKSRYGLQACCEGHH